MANEDQTQSQPQNLSDYLGQALDLLAAQVNIPDHQEVLFIEACALAKIKSNWLWTVTQSSTKAPLELPRSSVFTLQQYTERFEELLKEGRSWINLEIVGLVERSLIVVVQWGSVAQWKPGTSGRSQVNYAGPAEGKIKQLMLRLN